MKAAPTLRSMQANSNDRAEQKPKYFFLLQWAVSYSFDKKGFQKYGISVVCLHRLENRAMIGKYV